jgi:hypothetical protein
MRNVILKSFETFLREPLSILRNKIINVVNLRTSLLDSKSIQVEILKDALQVNVVNSQNAYNLLSAVIYKQKMNELRTLESQVENKKRTIFN